MKTLVASVVLLAAIEAPAWAQSPGLMQEDAALQSQAAAQKQTTVKKKATRPTVRSGSPYSSNPEYDVYVNGVYVGSDPDPRIRSSLRREWIEDHLDYRFWR